MVAGVPGCATTTCLLVAAHCRPGPTCATNNGVGEKTARPERAIDVFLADDNLIVRDGVRAPGRARMGLNADLRGVGGAADYAEVISGASATEPQVLVTDVRMPPSFHREGIDAAKEVRKRFRSE